jgi:hypothetical protein
MYNLIFSDMASQEHNRRLREQQAIAQMYNQAERKEARLFAAKRVFKRLVNRQIMSRLPGFLESLFP